MIATHTRAEVLAALDSCEEVHVITRVGESYVRITKRVARDLLDRIHRDSYCATLTHCGSKLWLEELPGGSKTPQQRLKAILRHNAEIDE